MSEDAGAETAGQREPCHYCGGNTVGGTPFQATLMHRELREERHFKIPRCAGCYRRHQGWVVLLVVGIVLAAAGFRLQKSFEDNPGIRMAFLALGVTGLLLGLGSQWLWKRFLNSRGPRAPESYGLEHPLIQQTMAAGFTVGQFKRNEDGSLAE